MQPKLTYSRTPKRSRENEFCPCGKSNNDNKFCSFAGFEGQGKGKCFACDKTYFPDKENGITYSIDTANEPKKRPYYKTVGEALSDYTSHLHSFMQNFAGEDLSTHFEKYCIGTDPRTGKTVFGIADSTGDVLNLKYFQYQDNGKRKQDQNPYYTKDCERCLYGLHLYDSAKPTIIVESEKTAQALGLYFDDEYNFLATGGANGSRKEHFLPLIGNEVYYFCDNDIAGRKNKNIDYLRELHNENQIQLKIIDTFVHHAPKYDLGDYLFEFRQDKTGRELKQWINKASFAPKPKAKPEPKASYQNDNLPTQAQSAESHTQETQEQPTESEPPQGNSQKAELTKIKEYLGYRYIFRRNIISQSIEFATKQKPEAYQVVNINNLFCELLEVNFRVGKNIVEALLDSDFVPNYNPITAYFESLTAYKPETDKDYITQYAHFVTFDKPQEKVRFAIALKKHLVRMIAQVYKKGYYNKQCLMIVGEKQDTGKTSYLEFLCPPFLEEYIRKDLPQISDMTHKDNRFALSQNFIINLDEIKSYNQKELNFVKSLFSYEKVKDRKHHANQDTTMKRVASFIGSTNNNNFLTDETGSVRWLCFGNVTKIDFSYRQKVDINNIWRQAWHLFNSDFNAEVSADEKAESETINRENYSEVSIEEELLLQYFEPDTQKQKLYFKTTSQILLQLEKLANSRKLNLNKLGQALKKYNFPKGSERTPNPAKGYYALPTVL